MGDHSHPEAGAVGGSGGDTIFALSSGAGIAGVAVVRVSGPAADDILRRLGGAGLVPRRASLREIRDPATGEVLDRGLLLWFPAPHSFTGENMAEIHIHGGRAVIGGVLGGLGACSGARPAEAGEFTLRAFRNGKLDLLEAEGLADLLQARTARQRRLALHQADGGASAKVEAWRASLIGILGRVEAAVDFIDEAGVAAEAMADVGGRIGELVAEFGRALEAQRRGEAIRGGFRVVLSGPPNAGKSSLFNALAGREAAIVSARPGTTRDVIEAEIAIAGVPVTLCDTAGLRAESGDEIELEGMARSRAQVARADLAIWIVAPDLPIDSVEPAFDSDVIRVLNKCDLLPENSRLNRNESSFMAISAATGEGIAALLAAVEEKLLERIGGAGDIAIVRERHRAALERARGRLAAALNVSRETPELMAEELRGAALDVGRITGAINVEDVLGAIFGEFCIGK